MLGPRPNLIYISCTVVAVTILLQCGKISAQTEETGFKSNKGQEPEEPPEHREFLSQFVPKPIRNLFENNSSNKMDRKRSSETEAVNEVTEKPKEFFVSGIINNIAKVTNSITKTIGDVGENIVKTLIPTTGLDSNKTFFSGLEAEFKKKVRAIFPGTLWCGDGSIARGFDDLGTFNKTDNCCRSHDFCSNSIESGESKYGLSNTGLFTRSHCDCDIEFYECLKTANTIIALKIGFTYFSVLGPQCFREDYPIVRCKRNQRGPLGSNRCVLYEQEENATKLFQWFDAKFF